MEDKDGHMPHSLEVCGAPDVEKPMRFGPTTAAQLSPEQHKRLANHCLRLLHINNESRVRRNMDMAVTENDLLGAVIPTGTDCDRAIKRAELKDVSIPDSIYPYGWMNIQRFVSDLMELVFPVEAPYAVAVSAENQQMARSFTKAFRAQGVMFDHRTNIQNALFDAVALDFGGLEFKWSTRASATSKANLAGGGISSPDDVKGMEIRQLDPYNICYDESVPMPDLAAEGEFCAYFDIVTDFRLRRDAKRGKCFLDPELIEQLAKRTRTVGYDLAATDPDYSLMKNWFYYQPQIAQRRAEVIEQWGTNRAGSNGGRIQTNFGNLFTHNQRNRYTSNLVHKTVMYVRLVPQMFGLRPSVNRRTDKEAPLEIWEIHILGDGYISFAAPVQTKADLLPVAVAGLNFRRTRERSLNMGHHYAQMSLLVSTILNMHKRSMRKGIEGGLTVYNSDVVDLSGLEDTSTGRIPARMRNFDQDLRKHIMQLSDTPDYKNTITDAQRILEVMGSILPTNANPMMAGLDRATTYQAQAVMATAMRGLVYYATTMDSQFLVPARFYMHHLNMLNAQELTYVDETSAQLITMSAEDINKATFQLVQSQPLMGIDRLRIENILREMMTILIQGGGQLSPTMAVLVRHWFGVAGVNVGFEEYEKAIQQEMAAMAQAQAAAANEANAKAQAAQAQDQSAP